MQVLVHSENLHLSDQTRRRIEETLGKLNTVVPAGAQVRLFLQSEGKQEVRAILTVRDHHNSKAYSARGSNLLTLVRSARIHLTRQLRDDKQKRVHSRKRRQTMRVAA